MNYADRIDHTLLKPEAVPEQIRNLCREAKEYGFHSVCVNSSYVPLCAEELKNSGIAVCSVVGFPLGAMSTRAKASEAAGAVLDGASEIDMVLHIGMVKSGNWEYVKNDIAMVRAAVNGTALLKVILETCLLTEEEMITACRICCEAGADYVKTSTGFSAAGATEEAVRLMKKTVGNAAKVKASGGIRTLADAEKMILAGADRLGASAGVQIVEESRRKEGV